MTPQTSQNFDGPLQGWGQGGLAAIEPLETGAAVLEIPQIFHFVWLGNSPIPENERAKIGAWKWHHSDWRVVVWCGFSPESIWPRVHGSGSGVGHVPERASNGYGKEIEGVKSSVAVPFRPVVHRESIEFRPLPKSVSGPFFAQTLHYEIVARYGGVCVQTGVDCFGNIENLLAGVRLFVAEESEAVSPTPIFGAVPNHPAFWNLVRDLGRGLASRESGVDSLGAAYLLPIVQNHPDCVVYPQATFERLCDSVPRHRRNGPCDGLWDS